MNTTPKPTPPHWSHVPFRPARWPFFYGWVVLVMGGLGTLMSIPGQTAGVSAFTEPLLEALSISRVDLSLAYMVGTTGSALCLTAAGRFCDRHGERVTGALASALLGLTLLGLTRVDGAADWLAHRTSGLSASMSVMVVMSVAFLALRFFGQGVLTLVARNMVMKWFDRRRGLANALLGLIASFGFSGAPALLNGLILAAGWRGAWTRLGLFIGIAFTLLTLLFYRDSPESCGLRPDGDLSGPRSARRPKSRPDRDFTLSEARRTYAFWPFTLSMAMFGLYATAMTFHVASIFEAAELSHELAFRIFIPIAAISVTVQFIGGWASDYLRLKYLLVAQVMAGLLSMGSLMILGPGAPVVLLIVGNGLSGGLFGVLAGVTWPRFYGVKHLGAISGFSMGWIVAGSAIGPYLFGRSESMTGSYAAGISVCLVVTLGLLISAWFADNPALPRSAKGGDERS